MKNPPVHNSKIYEKQRSSMKTNLKKISRICKIGILITFFMAQSSCLNDDGTTPLSQETKITNFILQQRTTKIYLKI
jgi:hypothetical protein